MNEITSTSEMAERDWDPDTEPRDVDNDIVATKMPEGCGMEFHVSLRDYTMNDMEALIVDAAAKLILGKFGSDRLAKEIESKTVALVAEKADRALANVTSEIIDQPITPKYPFMTANQPPVTMRDFIGLTGREYLMANVGGDGKPSDDRRYGKSRIQHMVETFMSQNYKREIEKATNAAISEIHSAIQASHKAFLETEKARFREAMAKITA